MYIVISKPIVNKMGSLSPFPHSIVDLGGFAHMSFVFCFDFLSGKEMVVGLQYLLILPFSALVLSFLH